MKLAAYLVVPAVTVGLAGAVLATIAAPRTLFAVRVWGGPTDARGVVSVRVECVRRAVGIDDDVPMEGLAVAVGGETRQARCGADGTAEVSVPVGASSARVRVTRGGETLADGVALVGRETWLRRAHLADARLAAAGKLPIRGRTTGGALVLSTFSRVWLDVPEELRRPGALKITATGADVGELTLGPPTSVLVRPTFVTATLEIAKADDPTQTWEARLPIAPAAVRVEELRVTDDRVEGTVRTFTKRARAYVRVADAVGRRAATTLELTPDGQSGAFGKLSVPVPSLVRPAWLVVATEPEAGAASALSFPLPPDDAGDGRVVPDALWVDGMAPIAAREALRGGRLGQAVALLVLAGGVLEVLLLMARGRESKQRLAEHMAAVLPEEAEGAIERKGAGLTAAIAIVSVLFGFVVIGTVLVWRA